MDNAIFSYNIRGLKPGRGLSPHFNHCVHRLFIEYLVAFCYAASTEHSYWLALAFVA